MPWLDSLQAPLACQLPPCFFTHWRDLACLGDEADPFCCAPIWNLSYHAIFTPGRRIYYNTSKDAAVIFGVYTIPGGNIIFSPMEESWLFGQPLLGSAAPDLLHASLQEFHSIFPNHRLTFCISGIRNNSLLAQKLKMLFGARYHIYIHSHFTQASASLEGGMDGWLGRRSANHRAKIKKSARKAQQGGIVFERFRPDPDNVADIYNRMLAIEEKSWKGLAHHGMSDSPSREFYGYMIRKLASLDEALVMFARINDEDAGFIFGGIMDKWYRGQQFSYTKSAAPWSVGNLLQMEQIRWLCELGISRYDMGACTGPRMEYKLHWTEQFCSAYTWIMREAI